MDFFKPFKIFLTIWKAKCTYTCFFFTAFTFYSASAQITAPVQASISLSQPYSLRLSDYVQAGTNRVSASLTLLNNPSDPTIDRVQVKIRLVIENNTIRISTPETYQSPNAITLTEGVPEILDAGDLSEYFDPKNLDFIGLDKNQYLQTGRLPEGFYTFRLEVYEYFRGTRLTNQSPSALAWLMLNDPPRWVIPSAFQKLTATNPQNVLLQWLPMHTGSPNAVSGVQYDLTIVELWPNTNQNPNDALNTLSPFLTVNDIDATTAFIGPEAPQLVPGRTYAMRLRAHEASGFDLFKNNGYSEVISFTFGDACLPAESPAARARNSREANVNWVSKPNHTAYQVNYREAGQTVWYTDNATINDWTIGNLNPSKTYEYTITPQCQTLQGQPTDIRTFITPAATRADATCNTPVATTTSLPKSARTMLLPGEEYSGKGGKLKLIMDQVSKQPNGKFAGVGSSNFGLMPAMFAVEVTDLAVDMDGTVLDGKLKTITYGVYVIDAATYAQAEQTLNYAGTLLQGSPPSDANLAKLQDTLRSIRNLPPAAMALIQQGIADIKSGNTASGKATVQQGLAQAKTELSRSGNKGGNVIGGGNGNGKDLKPLAGLNIRFSNAPESNYGFDAKVYDQLASTYEQENGTYIPWKAIESGRTDPLLVTVSITGNRIKRDSIRYASQNGAKLALTNNRISPVGGSQGTATEVYALYPTTGSGTQNVAQVNVMGYTKEMNTVVIVPLGATLPINGQTLTDSLNRIFGQAVAGFSVEVKDVFRPAGWNGTVSIGGTGMLSAYTQSQRDIINAYRAAVSDFSVSKYYVFVGGTPSDPSIKGYMPRARKYGFIFDLTTTAKTLAHELGHGVFHLQHAFDEKSLPREGDNLMSYGSGTRLHKYQWDKVHNPEMVFGVLEEDEDAMSKALLNSKYVFMHDNLSGKSYTSKDEFTQIGIDIVDGKLEMLEKAGRKTYIYFEYQWIENKLIDMDSLINARFTKAKDEMKKRFTSIDYNLLVVLVAKYDPKLNAGVKAVSYREVFYPVTGLDESCAKKINDYLISSGRKKFVDGMDEALKERADKLLENLKDCKVEEPKDFIVPNVTWISQFDESIKLKYNKIDGSNLAICGCNFKSLGENGNTCCYCTCLNLILSTGLNLSGERIYLCELANVSDLQGGLINTGQFDNAIKYIDETIKKDNGKPLLVGLHYDNDDKSNPYNIDLTGKYSATMHFVIVVGKSYKNGKEYLRFYDVGRGNLTNGTSDENLLEINKNIDRVSGSYNGMTYTLIEIRKLTK